MMCLPKRRVFPGVQSFNRPILKQPRISVILLQDNPSDSGESYDCEAWWKRRAVKQRETNSFWSIFVAATVMGVVIIGHRWHQERWQVLQLRGQAGVSDH